MVFILLWFPPVTFLHTWWVLTMHEALLIVYSNGFSSFQFSRLVVSDSLWPHELQHARPPCPSPTPGVYPSSCPLSRWCHPTISSSVVPFSSCPQSFPASGSFPMSQLFIRWPKYWSFSFNISPSSEHPGLISSQAIELSHSLKGLFVDIFIFLLS